MRDYGIVSPRFWIGETGKLLRGDSDAQVLAVYLMTSPHSSMTGVFHCPLVYMVHETGLSLEGARKALARLIEVAFCDYEEASETVFVVRMAAYQIAESLKSNDKRVEGLRKDVAKMAAGRIKQRFLEVYGESFCLVEQTKSTSPYEAPCKPLRSQEQEQEQEQEQKRACASRATRIPDDWQPSPDERRWAEDARSDLSIPLEVEKFRDYWLAKSGADATKRDWTATWRNWIRNGRSNGKAPPAGQPHAAASAMRKL